MGATSVTGVGAGSAEGLNRGSARMTLGAGHLVGPHVVACGNTPLVGGVATINLGSLTDGASNYSLFVSNMTDTTAVGGTLADAVSPNVGVVVGLQGTGVDVVAYMVVKNGLTL
jgi:hypothetical protein